MAPLGLSAIWGFASDNVWAVGPEGDIVNWNGSSWVAWASTTGPAYGLTAIWGASPDDIWAMGPQTVSHFNGTVWAQIPGASVSPLGMGSPAIFGRSSSEVWIAEGNELAEWNGNGFVTTSMPVYLDAIWGTSAAGLWGVGEYGAILRHP
jgi:hypothetical protein